MPTTKYFDLNAEDLFGRNVGGDAHHDIGDVDEFFDNLVCDEV